jgi:hypothetical protein
MAAITVREFSVIKHKMLFIVQIGTRAQVNRFARENASVFNQTSPWSPGTGAGKSSPPIKSCLQPFLMPLLKIDRLPFWENFRLDNDLPPTQACPAIYDWLLT